MKESEETPQEEAGRIRILDGDGDGDGDYGRKTRRMTEKKKGTLFREIDGYFRMGWVFAAGVVLAIFFAVLLVLGVAIPINRIHARDCVTLCAPRPSVWTMSYGCACVKKDGTKVEPIIEKPSWPSLEESSGQ